MNGRAKPGRVVGIAEGVAAAVRRRQREREPRVAVFSGDDATRLIAPSAPGYDRLLEAAEAMLETAGVKSREPRQRLARDEEDDPGRGTAREPAA